MASSSVHTAPTFGSAAAAPPNQSPCSSINRDASGPRFIVVMGVSGTGKSTLGAALARAMHLPFIDGDDLHPAVNVAKMSRGEPLDDADRSPWLDTIRSTAVASVLEQLGEQPGVDSEAAGRPKTKDPAGARAGAGVVVACSSLKKTYRAVLRGDSGVFSGPCVTSLPTYFVYLKGDEDVLMARMRDRKGHFMKAGMLESQLRTLESPEGEPGVVSVSVEMPTAEQVQRVLEMLS